MRSTVLLCALFIGSLFPCLGGAAAEVYPSRAVKLIVPQPPGAQNDVLGRLLADALTELWKQPVVVENRGGAGGTVGAELAAKAPADGYTVALCGLNNLVIAPAVVKDLPYDPARDFVPIGGLARVPYALAVNPKVPATKISELIAYAKAHPGELTYGSGGASSMSNLGAQLLKSMADIDILHVPYRGSAPSIKALVSGQIDMMFADLSLLEPLAKARKLRLIAAAGHVRAAAAPDLPTVAEQGLSGYAIEPWYGLVVPAGTSPPAVAQLVHAMHDVRQRSELQSRLRQLGYEPILDTPAQFEALIRSESERYRALIKRAGIRANP